jgi:peptidoglycan/xylan/chitin deacetylase (PgdA/CDA1 family)
MARRAIGTLTHVTTTRSVAALTFDDGPHPDFTLRVLDLLERHRARATFFMLGEAARQHPELVTRVAKAGHAIGNHSWDHPSFSLIPGSERRRQIRACAQAIAPYGRRLFRPPFGEQNFGSHFDALWLRYDVVAWSLQVGDWWDADARRMGDLLITHTQPGSVVLLHDALRQHPCAERRPLLTREPYVDREPMLAALTMLLDHARGRLAFVTVPELLRQGQPHRSHWYRTTPPASRATAPRP